MPLRDLSLSKRVYKSPSQQRDTARPNVNEVDQGLAGEGAMGSADYSHIL